MSAHGRAETLQYRETPVCAGTIARQNLAALFIVLACLWVLNGCVGVTTTKQLPREGTGSHTVTLNWLVSESTVSGYNVYRSTTDGANYVKITASPVPTTNYVDSNVDSGTTYYYVTTAVDESGSESGYSNQASAVIP